MILTDIEQQELRNKVIPTNIKRLIQTNISVHKLAEEVCRHFTLTSRVMATTYYNETKRNLVVYESTVEPKAHADLSLTASENDYTLRHERFRRQVGKVEVVWTTHQRKVVNGRKTHF